MNMEVASRLVKLRKEKGLSQEELADKLGISRQAVSKWERAEASPDTDNLICLAKLYGISLDELLNTEDSEEEIKAEQVKKDDSINVNQEVVDDKDKRYVHVGPGGIHVKDENDEVNISWKGISVKSKDDINDEFEEELKIPKVSGIIEGVLFLLAAAGYILLGTLLDMWHNGWIVFFIPEIISSIIRSIEKKKFGEFNMTFVAVFAFFFVCMVIPGLDANLWHPMWVVFFAIPIYHTAVGPVDKYFKRKRLLKNGVEIVIDEKEDK